MKDLLIIGKVGAVYGILGWNKIFSYTEKKNNILQYQPWFLYHNNTWNQFFLKYQKICNKKIIVQFKNIHTRNQAKFLTNNIIAIQKIKLPKLNHLEYYWYDIITCQVFDKNKIYIGEVKNIIRTKTNDILVIKNKKSNQKEILIPFIENVFIKNVYLNTKTIQLNKSILKLYT
ncbi:Ribosome maturation factor RimM [Buchnera aphidicola (Takecallis arundicolens)]|uniref:ribosome maturation factor RimM n=1 Tax=Buchnera aphidicola TaxID=9 RepID=UPI0034638807